MADQPVPVPIVAIGASAGGLEPLRALFTELPLDLGAAYVVLTHSDPRRESMLAELLGRCTSLPVCNVYDQLELRPNHVYVSPTGDSLRLDGDLLQHDPDTGGSSHRRLPVDRFFRSVARHRGPRAVGILLSGSGSDGTQGAKEIRGHGGLVITQDRSEAQYDGMPWSAIQARAVDAELPIAEIPDRISRYLQRLPADDHEPEKVRADDEAEQPYVERLIEHLETEHGHDFSGYKRTTIQRRMHKRMLVGGFDEPGDYLARLYEDPKESEAMFRDLFIGVSSFFRDPEAFDALEREALRPLVEAHADRTALRAWVPGCSSGEEAFSIAMLLFEENKRQRRQAALQVFGTDVDPFAIERARSGVYPETIVQDVEKGRLNRHFRKEDGAYRVDAHIREPVVFARHDVLVDPPFTRLDLVSCRNLLIYLSPEAQDRLIPLFHYALRRGATCSWVRPRASASTPSCSRSSTSGGRSSAALRCAGGQPSSFRRFTSSGGRLGRPSARSRGCARTIGSSWSGSFCVTWAGRRSCSTPAGES
jgi:two-component system CheB/CheR fusion protein